MALKDPAFQIGNSPIGAPGTQRDARRGDQASRLRTAQSEPHAIVCLGT